MPHSQSARISGGMKRLVHGLRRLVGAVAEPKDITLISAAAYTIGLAIGIYALIKPPNSLEGALGELAMISLAGLLTAGSAIGLPMCLIGEWKIERRGALGLCSLATVIYIVVVITLHVQGDGNRLLQAGFICVVLLAIIARARHIWDRPEAPKKEKVIGDESGTENTVGLSDQA